MREGGGILPPHLAVAGDFNDTPEVFLQPSECVVALSAYRRARYGDLKVDDGPLLRSIAVSFGHGEGTG